MHRGLLTERDREIIEADKHKRKSEIRTLFRYRLENLQKDIEIIEEHDEKLAEEFRDAIYEPEYVGIEDILDAIEDEVKTARERIENSKND